METAIKAFEKTHPNVTVNYTYYTLSPQFLTALKTAAASNTLPDVIGLSPGSLTQEYRSYLSPINGLAKKTWGPNWTKRVLPIDLAQMKMGNPRGDNNYYILPQESQVLSVWYNRQIFKKLHLTVPKTLPQLVKVSKALSAGGYMPMYQGAGAAWQNENVFILLADQQQANLFEKVQLGKASWTSPGMVRAMTTWGELFNDGVFQSGALGGEPYPTGADLFAAGRVGMITFGSWWLQEPQLPPPVPPLVKGMKGFGWFPFPAGPGATSPGPTVGGIDVGVGLTKYGAKDPAAWEFMASLVDGAGAQAVLNKDLNDLPAFNNLSAPRGLGSSILLSYKQFMKVLPSAQNQRFYSPVVETAVDNALAGVAAGKLTPKAALASIAATQRNVGPGTN
jgi:raffinose/stachyose/melibiose transport system substrate-binding protein